MCLILHTCTQTHTRTRTHTRGWRATARTLTTRCLSILALVESLVPLRNGLELRPDHRIGGQIPVFKHMHMYVGMYIYMYIHIHKFVLTSMYDLPEAKRTHTHVRTHKCTHTNTHAHSYVQTNTQTHMHTCTYTPVDLCGHQHVHVAAESANGPLSSNGSSVLYTYVCMYVCMYAHLLATGAASCTRMYVCTCVCMYVYMYAVCTFLRMLSVMNLTGTMNDTFIHTYIYIYI